MSEGAEKQEREGVELDWLVLGKEDKKREDDTAEKH